MRRGELPSRTVRPLPIVIGVPLVLALLGASAGGGGFAVGGFWLGATGVVVWALFDAVGRPRYAWAQTGQNRTMWLTLLGGGLLFCGIVGYLSAIIYFASIRGRLSLAR